MNRTTYRIACFAMLLTVSTAFARSITIQSDAIPLEVGTYGRYHQNRNIFTWSRFDSTRTHWDLTGYPGGNTARIGLRPAAEGVPPAPDSMNTVPPEPEVLEQDTLGDGTTQDIYLHKSPVGLWINGIDVTQEPLRLIGNYRPNQNVYNTPMDRGAGWTTEVTWVYEVLPGIFVIFNQQNTKRIIARGKVRVPMSGEYYWPCLVIRDHYQFRDNMGGTPQLRWIYEWVVPGQFLGANGVAAAISQNGASEDFLNVDQFFQLEQLAIPGWDLVPPTFAAAVELEDTADLGPYIVSTKILDNETVGPESLFYRVDEGEWQGVGSDSSGNDTYFYTIPAVTGPARVDYFYWAMDAFSAAESLEFWTTWPVCSPESTMITFLVGQVGVEDGSGRAGNPEVSVSPNPASGPVRFSVRLPYGQAHVPALQLYSTTGRLLRSLTLYADNRGQAQVTWDGTDFRGRRLAAGAYIWQISTGTETHRGKVVLER